MDEQKKLCTTSPKSDWLWSGLVTPVWLMQGTMLREIRFQSSLRLDGTTGWMFSVDFDPWSSAPRPSSQLCWKGTLLSEATGF